ncbi:hypothetical protein SAMN04489713_1011148 [Actinomadura madurae]|uniref:Uncharacterized protein n=1 Tax=Actinomadura madurae TaxID=1993 RepID=A0A1I4Y3G1_9ACTN|nr:hypothetical protein SAMN04489713_1011148 [Actinomadura madurae]SPT63767.1 Uncharacterised protein [Actinomadura madurae]
MRTVSMKTRPVVRTERPKGGAVVLNPWWT